MNLTKEQLRILIAAGESQSFSQAARKLGKAQSNISTTINHLELDLGITVFERTNQGTRLTAAGELLLSEARFCLDGLNRFEQTALAFSRGEETHLVLAVDEIYPPQQLAWVLSRFSECFPYCQLEILSGVLNDIGVLVRNGQADLGIMVATQPAQHGLLMEQIGRQPFVAVASGHHPLARERDLVPNRLAQFRQIIATSRWGDSPAPNTLFSNQLWKVESSQLVLSLLRQGVGWAFLPRYLITPELAELNLAMLEVDSGPHCPEFLFWRPDWIPGQAGVWLKEQLLSIRP